VAIDEEMTGISLPDQGRPRKEHTPSQRYDDVKLVPERYSIIQLGISLHRGRSVRKYNFYVFPNAESGSAREIVLNPGTVQFLNRHGMNFDVWSKCGIPYCTREQAADVTYNYLASERKERTDAAAEAAGAQKQPSVQETLARRVELRRSDDVEFVARTMASLREWLDSPVGVTAADDESSQTQLLLPPCNSFLRRALYENITMEYPNLILESVAQDPTNAPNGSNKSNHLQIRVLRLTPAERQQRRERLQAERWERYVVEKIGMWRVVSAIRQVCSGIALDYSRPEWSPCASRIDWDASSAPARMPPRLHRRIPLVVHNGWMDLLFLMTHFESPRLPPTLVECKELVRSYFPTIFDTKVLSVEYCGYGAMDLATLYDAVGDKTLRVETGEPAAGGKSETPESSASDGSAHQADYDAYMTGAVFMGLSRHLRPVERPEEEEEEGEVSDEYIQSRSVPAHWYASNLGRNRIYNLGLFTLDLENTVDPLAVGMTPGATFRVAGIHPSITTRDIVSPLNNLVDEHEQPVNFDLVWVDDTTFIVATRYRPSSEATMGSLVSASETIPTSDLDVEWKTILEEHGQLVRGVLEARFGAEYVSTLGEYLKLQEKMTGSDATRGRLTRFLEFIGLKRNTRERATDEGGSSTKRQRRN
jgi:poly(A)-specific ribonuclease